MGIRSLSFILFFVGINSFGQEVNFNKHIAPIIHLNCTPCHRPGEAGPFPLITFQDVAKRGKMIREVVTDSYMPPWKADNSYRTFKNQKGLTDNEISTIRTWVENGMPRGDSADKPESPIYPEGSQIGNPSLGLSVKKSFIIPGNNNEEFVLFVIPFEGGNEKNVRAIEFIPGNRKLMHHANFGIYEVDPEIEIYGDDEPINARDMNRYADRFQELSKNMVYYNGWIPGSSAIEFPKGMGFKLPKRGVIILTTHYAPSPVVEKDKSSINLFFTDTEITKPIETLSIGSGGIGSISPPLVIPANQRTKHYVRMEILKPMSLLYVWPHMHLLGKTFKAYAITPDKKTIPLVRINSWDFNWQEAYQFNEVLNIPAGSVLTVEGTFDNTQSNPANPFDPPQTIYSDGLMQTTNEMLSLILIFLKN